MPAHKHAAHMHQYARDAAEILEPWTRWQVRMSDREEWVLLTGNPSWKDCYEYRRRPNDVQYVGVYRMPAGHVIIQNGRPHKDDLTPKHRDAGVLIAILEVETDQKDTVTVGKTTYGIDKPPII